MSLNLIKELTIYKPLALLDGELFKGHRFAAIANSQVLDAGIALSNPSSHLDLLVLLDHRHVQKAGHLMHVRGARPGAVLKQELSTLKGLPPVAI